MKSDMNSTWFKLRELHAGLESFTSSSFHEKSDVKLKSISTNFRNLQSQVGLKIPC